MVWHCSCHKYTLNEWSKEQYSLCPFTCRTRSSDGSSGHGIRTESHHLPLPTNHNSYHKNMDRFYSYILFKSTLHNNVFPPPIPSKSSHLPNHSNFCSFLSLSLRKTTKNKNEKPRYMLQIEGEFWKPLRYIYMFKYLFNSDLVSKGIFFTLFQSDPFCMRILKTKDAMITFCWLVFNRSP